MSIRHPIRGSRRYGRGSRDFGYADGRNIQFEERWAEVRNDRLDGLAQELIDSKVDILVAMMGPALVAARQKTSTVPIVMAVSSDGVGTVGVASIARPGGNVTGVTLMSPDLVGLRLALLREAAPAAAHRRALQRDRTTDRTGVARDRGRRTDLGRYSAAGRGE
jgi:ABC-type uncharacterized transport system substrate-binding protein